MNELPQIDLTKYRNIVTRLDTVRANGLVVQVIGLVVESIGPAAQIGEICEIRHNGGRNSLTVKAEVVGFKSNRVLLMPLGEMTGIKPGSEVIATGDIQQVTVGDFLLGRVLDGLGAPADSLGPATGAGSKKYPIFAAPPDAMTRRRITEPVSLGIRAIDGLLTMGKGQRMGIFAGSGVGKSTVLGMIARRFGSSLKTTSAKKACAARSSSLRLPTVRRWCASKPRWWRQPSLSTFGTRGKTFS